MASLAALAGSIDGPWAISQSGHGAFQPRLTRFGRGFAVAWHDTRDGHPEIYARLLDATGHPAGPELRLTNGPDRAYEPDIAASGDNLVVAWYDVAANRTPHAKIGMWSREGRSIWVRSLASLGRPSKNPVVRTRGREIFCAWITENAARDPEVVAGWFDTQGNPTVPAMVVGPVGVTTWNVNATIDDDGTAWVTYDSKIDTRQSEIFVARVGKSSASLTRVTTDDGKASKSPDLAVGGGRVALTWFDERDRQKEVYLFMGRPEELKEGLEARAIRVTDTPGESIDAYVAWNPKQRRFGLAWCDDTEGQHEIYFEAFDPRGAPPAGPLRLTQTPTQSMIPAIMPTDDGFALVWNEYEGTRHDLHEADDARSEVAFALIR
jgi:hypothetical protein